jgi:GntR family transcriptional repressor for pyruvate dehydrogenase complex
VAEGSRWSQTGQRQARTMKVSELVARNILHDIASRKLEPGTKLPSEAEMVEQYDVARASLREALRILEVHGLIRIRQGLGGGPLVGQVTSQDFAGMSTMYFHMAGATLGELFEARLLLETQMASYAATRQDDGLLAALQANLDAASSLGGGVPEDVHSEIARDFHSVITGLSGNRVLDLLSQGIKDIYVDRVRGFSYDVKTQRKVHKAHSAIAEAIIAGNADLAGKLMRNHMEDYLRRSILANAPGFLEEVVDWR